MVGDFGPLENLGTVIEILRAPAGKIRGRLVAGAVATDEEKQAYVKTSRIAKANGKPIHMIGC